MQYIEPTDRRATENRVVYCGKGGERLKVSLDSLDEEIKKNWKISMRK